MDDDEAYLFCVGFEFEGGILLLLTIPCFGGMTLMPLPVSIFSDDFSSSELEIVLFWANKSIFLLLSIPRFAVTILIFNNGTSCSEQRTDLSCSGGNSNSFLARSPTTISTELRRRRITRSLGRGGTAASKQDLLVFFILFLARHSAPAACDVVSRRI